MKKLMLFGYKVILNNLACILLFLALIPFDYPRHVLAGYLAIGYGVLLLTSGFGMQETAR